jgi:hypothetical protein
MVVVWRLCRIWRPSSAQIRLDRGFRRARAIPVERGDRTDEVRKDDGVCRSFLELVVTIWAKSHRVGVCLL